jgi:ankyrin repeat protein
LAAAASERDASMVEFLLARGADVNAADDEGRTPLMGAAAAGDAALLKALLDKGADIDAVDKSGRTAWNHAVRNGHPDTAKFLEAASVKR